MQWLQLPDKSYLNLEKIMRIEVEEREETLVIRIHWVEGKPTTLTGALAQSVVDALNKSL